MNAKKNFKKNVVLFSEKTCLRKSMSAHTSWEWMCILYASNSSDCPFDEEANDRMAYREVSSMYSSPGLEHHHARLCRFTMDYIILR